MKENCLWGYEEIYGDGKPEYKESLDRAMKDALDYLCARVRRSGDFWDALRTASAMYCVNLNDLREHFERRKNAGIERRNSRRKRLEKWYAVRYSYSDTCESPHWMFLKETDPMKAELTVIHSRKRPDCRISVEACLPFGTRDEADRYASSWDDENRIRQLPLPAAGL